VWDAERALMALSDGSGSFPYECDVPDWILTALEAARKHRQKIERAIDDAP
jgi:hypothetical protein